MTNITSPADPLVADVPLRIPPLENGDCLTRAEFERRYEAMPHIKKAELIEGEVHMPSPVRLTKHSSPNAEFIGWLIQYQAATPGVTVGVGGTIRLDATNEFQPDGFMLIHPDLGGKVRLSADDYVEGAPEFVGEISSSTVSIDLNKKLNVYRRNGVQEYFVWRVLDNAVDWFVLQDGDFKPLPKDDAGCIRSLVFPGLWLDVEALLRDDLATVLTVLQKGLESPEHQQFVTRLQKLTKAAD
jgi:Uma2 family endonuclease